jgi:hypothetical protein
MQMLGKIKVEAMVGLKAGTEAVGQLKVKK